MKRKGLTASMVILAMGIAISVWGDSTTLTISNGSDTVTSPASTTLNFPISRTGDTSYDAFLQFQTVDGTAVAGVDYTAASGSLLIPAGQSSAMIPVTIAGRFNNPANKTFQMLFGGAVGAGMGFTSSFAAQQTFGTGVDPFSVTVADLNGDGLPDLIVANQADNTVSVLLNTTAPGATTPSFAAPQSFATGGAPVSVVAADVNGDGLPDLIVANENDSTVSVLLNTTTPGSTTASFGTEQPFFTGTAPRSVTTADLNGDGRPDLIVVNSSDNTISVLLNTTTPGASTPSFATQHVFSVGSEPESVTAADLNGDGRPDLIVANEGDNTVSVLLDTTSPGAATPSFTTQTTFATGSAPVAVAAADVNGDGRPDVIVANALDNTVSVLLDTTAPGASVPSFSGAQAFATGHTPFALTAADVNGDGRPDVIVANQTDNTVSVLLNITAPGALAPSFAAQQTFATGTNQLSVTAADINGDGKLDLIAVNEGDNTVSVLLNTTPAPATTLDGNSFATHQDFGTGSQPFQVTTADINGDGLPDLIVSNESGATVSVLLNTTAPGATIPSFASQQTFATGHDPGGVTAVDVNGDGKPDLIVANDGDNTVSVLLNTTAPGAATPSFAAQQTFAAGNAPALVTTADINGDGKPDLIVTNINGNTVSVLLNTTTPGAITPSFAAQQTFATGGSPAGVTAADLNGDGLPDLVIANFGSNTVSVLRNTTAPGAVTPSFAVQQTFATGNVPNTVKVADINGDGLPDLIVANQTDNTVSVLLNTTAPGATTFSFAPQQTFATGVTPATVAVADVNGDGKPDLIVPNVVDNTVSVLLNTTAPGAATPSFAIQQTFAVGKNPGWVQVADLNGDGKPDLIAANETDDTVSVLLNTLYAATASGSPATGTIHYSIPLTTASLTALAFGNVPVGDTLTKNITVKNTGANPLYVDVRNVTSNDPEFAATGPTTCPGGGLAHLATCTITIEFTPSALGPHSATISITDNTASSPQHVAATGAGVADLTVTPTTFMFTSTKIGSTKTKTITVSNKQTNSVSLTLPPGFSGTNSNDFSQTGGTCMATLAAKASCTLIVTYAPTQLGTESATMTVTDSPDTLGPYTVSFTTAANIPATVAPATLAFGTTTVAHPNKTKDLTVTNLSAFALSVSEGGTTGPNAGDFAVTGGTCGGTVSANSTCTIAIAFTPTLHATPESASIAVTIGSDPTSPHNIALTGTGP
jgi:hypothetical protein